MQNNQENEVECSVFNEQYNYPTESSSAVIEKKFDLKISETLNISDKFSNSSENEITPQSSYIKYKINKCLSKARLSSKSNPQTPSSPKSFLGTPSHFSPQKLFQEKKSRSIHTITDICSTDNIPEVEIISLVQEQLPSYKLKVDAISSYSGYEDQDWIVPFPALESVPPDILSPEQAEETLHYFVLCGNRVNQMTRTYHDIEAVTRLLQEKEKDLELAARIGQQLLSRNKSLEEKNSALEAEILSCNDKITQLQHDLAMKAELLHIYSNDFDESSVEASPVCSRSMAMDLLQRRVRNLESENVSLREETVKLATDTEYCEDKEKELVNDVIKQLSSANEESCRIGEELSKKIEENFKTQDENTQLLAQLVEIRSERTKLQRENEDFRLMVSVARNCQEELAIELTTLKEKHAEVVDILNDTQEHLRIIQMKQNIPGNRLESYGSGTNDSIATELQSLISEDDVDGTKNLDRVFDIVRLSGKLNRTSHTRSSSIYQRPYPQNRDFLAPHDRVSSYFGGKGPHNSGVPSLDSGAESDMSFHTDSEDNYPASYPGVPGYPGTPDLDSCLKRLCGHSEKRMMMSGGSSFMYSSRTPDSIMSTGNPRWSMGDWKVPQKLQIVKPMEGSMTLQHWARLATPNLCGLMDIREGIAMKGATCNVNADLLSDNELDFTLKNEPKTPITTNCLLETDIFGSTPTPGTLQVSASKTQTPGVACTLYNTSCKTTVAPYPYTHLNTSMSKIGISVSPRTSLNTSYSQGTPGKPFNDTVGIFTLTNSTVLHPDDVTSLTPSINSAKLASGSPLSITKIDTPTNFTPQNGVSGSSHSRRGSTSTFSTNVGIAKHLGERLGADIDRERGTSPPGTPANSPVGSRPSSPDGYYYKLPTINLEDLTKSLSKGANYLRRKIYGETHSTNSSPILNHRPKFLDHRSKFLSNSVQNYGLNQLMGPEAPPQYFGGVIAPRTMHSNSLLHLSKLMEDRNEKYGGDENENSGDKIKFDGVKGGENKNKIFGDKNSIKGNETELSGSKNSIKGDKSKLSEDKIGVKEGESEVNGKNKFIGHKGSIPGNKRDNNSGEIKNYGDRRYEKDNVISGDENKVVENVISIDKKPEESQNLVHKTETSTIQASPSTPLIRETSTRTGSGSLDRRLSQLKPGQRTDLGTVGPRKRPADLGTVPRVGKLDEKIGTFDWKCLGRKGGLM